MDEVIKASEDALKFCHERGLDDRSSIIASLAIEELTRNIIEQTGKDHLSKHQHIDVRVVAKNGLTIRVRDNCPDFDAKKRLDQFIPADDLSNIGIRMLRGMASSMNYQKNAGIDTMMVKLVC